jgi:hypothetical protein
MRATGVPHPFRVLLAPDEDRVEQGRCQHRHKTKRTHSPQPQPNPRPKVGKVKTFFPKKD